MYSNYKGEGGWKTTYKIDILQLFETKKNIFSKEIMRG